MNPCTLLMSFRCIKAFMHAFSGRFSRTCLEGISFKFFVCFIFNVSLGSAPKRKNFDIQRNTRVASGGQFTLNYHTPSHMLQRIKNVRYEKMKPRRWSLWTTTSVRYLDFTRRGPELIPRITCPRSLLRRSQN